MSATGQGPHTSAADVYQGFIGAVNRQDLEEAARFVDAARYRENCVGFTRGFVDWEEAKKSVRQVWKGLPDLRVDLGQVLASGEDLAHGTVRGAATGRLYGAPATKRSFQASFFDYVRVDDGRIIERSSKPTCSPRCASCTARRSAWSGSTPWQTTESGWKIFSSPGRAAARLTSRPSASPASPRGGPRRCGRSCGPGTIRG